MNSKKVEDMQENEIIDRLFTDPRTEWERQLRKYALNFKTYTYADTRSIDAFCDLVATFYREILKLSLLLGRKGEL